ATSCGSPGAGSRLRVYCLIYWLRRSPPKGLRGHGHEAVRGTVPAPPFDLDSLQIDVDQVPGIAFASQPLRSGGAGLDPDQRGLGRRVVPGSGPSDFACPAEVAMAAEQQIDASLMEPVEKSVGTHRSFGGMM